ncbi:NAD(P)H-dependent oxidoreductase [Arenibaculum sp.]|jgi:putative NADPH-quinone reductase|uniref:NAD(P)H-dependent oxidoreductase n=1 Tax=Arenibaculum sp. TaxID=2865862 RepID=UPI002E1178B5|nr:NAD(P)H-dependent oxidoreductase [Arenibaculum sp.]
MTRIVIVQGHPTPGGGHYCHALADAYAEGAAAAGHELRRIEVAELDFPLLRSRQEWEAGTPPPAIAQAQDAIGWAGHLVIVYPLWLGTMPALLKGFLEQTMRPGFAVGGGRGPAGTGWRKGLAGRSARIVVTMGMPAFVYRWYFGAHSLRSLERNVLAFAGIRPCRHSLVGMVEGMGDAKRRRWLDRMRALGRAAR